jgi:phosphatidate cytidylyltransferase
MLGRRILTAVVLLPAALAALFLLPPTGWRVAAGLVILIGADEWARLAGWRTQGRVAFAIAIAASLLAAGAMPPSWIGFPWILALATWLWASVALAWLRGGWQVRSWWAMALTGWWVLVPAWLATVLLQRRPGQLLAVMAVVWVADTAAFFAGRRFGRNKLAPGISPGKTWEGVFGALAGVTAYYLLLVQFAPSLLGAFGFLPGLILVGVLATLGVVGDLFESWMKRVAGVKDSGKLLPGHGGVLDRIDALTASLPLAALAIWMTG